MLSTHIPTFDPAFIIAYFLPLKCKIIEISHSIGRKQAFHEGEYLISLFDVANSAFESSRAIGQRK
jgi:hypothetical protein